MSTHVNATDAQTTHQQLLSDLKSLWKVQDTSLDNEAIALIEQFANIENQNSLDLEHFDIQRKVLAKTRQKTEELLAKIEQIESARI